INNNNSSKRKCLSPIIKEAAKMKKYEIEEKVSIEKQKLQWDKEKVEKENIKDKKQQQNNLIIELILQIDLFRN
ncbi:4150_t:CDS:2, partial [Gigaspora rosea]